MQVPPPNGRHPGLSAVIILPLPITGWLLKHHLFLRTRLLHGAVLGYAHRPMVDSRVSSQGEATLIDPKVQSSVARVGRAIRWASALYSIVVAGSAATGLLKGTIQQTGPGMWRRVAPSLAVGMAILASGSLAAGEARRAEERQKLWQRAGATLALLAGLLGLFLMAAVILHLSTPLTRDQIEMPAFSGGLSLFVLGLSVPLVTSRLDMRIIVGQVGSLMIFSLSGAILIAYGFGDPSIGRLVAGPHLSFQAAVIVLVLSVGILLIRPGSGIVSVASSPGAGGQLLRKFGPAALATPALLLLLAEAQPASERIDVLAFVAVGLGLLLLTLLAVVVRTIDQTAVDASAAAAEAERAKVGLEQEAPLVADLAALLHVVELNASNGFDVATRFRPAAGPVSGDATGIRQLSVGRIGVVLVDVTGHGAGPAVQAVRTRDLLMSALSMGASPAEALNNVAGWLSSDSFSSAIALVIDTPRETGTYASAGHQPAILTSTQSRKILNSTGPLLHLDSSIDYDEESFRYGAGDTLVVFSDGIADVQRERGDRTEVEELSILLLAEGGNASRTADLVLGFSESEPTDDQTVVVIHSAVSTPDASFE